MSATKKARSKRKVKRAGAKALRADKRPNTYPRRDAVTAPPAKLNGNQEERS